MLSSARIVTRLRLRARRCDNAIVAAPDTRRASSLLRSSSPGPVLADADVDRERRVEVVRAAHLLLHDRPDVAHLGLGRLEQQLVVHLEHEARGAALVPQPAVDADHRHLDDVGVRALHDEVHGQPLAEGARLPARRADLGHGSPPAEQARHVAVALRLLDRAGDEVLHVREPREVRVDVRLSLVARDLEVLRQPVRGDAVDDPEVDHLRDRALVLRQRRRLPAEHLGGGRGVDVLAGSEGGLELRLAGDVGEDAQLDLRVVGRYEAAPFLGDERGADLAAELGADRDRLEVRDWTWTGGRLRRPPG